jgi:hypothetical protein
LDPSFLYIIKKKNPKLMVFEDPKVPCGNLDPAYKTMLMDLSLSLDAWRSLFVVLKALRDNGGDLVTEEDVKCKQAEVATLLKTPGKLKKSGDATSQALFEETLEPPKVETTKLQVIQDESWILEGVPPSLVAHLGDIKDTLLQTVDTIPGLYRDFSAIHQTLANDIDTLQTVSRSGFRISKGLQTGVYCHEGYRYLLAKSKMHTRLLATSTCKHEHAWIYYFSVFLRSPKPA